MAKVVESPAEQKVVLRGISWETYERLLADRLDSSVPHFTYDRGTLEIMSPMPAHEKIDRTVSLFVDMLAAEMELDAENLGSTTFKREDLQRGFEPDSCFYFRDAKLVRGKDKLDLTVDPPPELIVEIDISSPSLNKLPIYAQLSVPEVWRYDGAKATILRLSDGEYGEVAESGILPRVTGEVIASFVRRGASLERPAWVREVRRWAQESDETWG